MSSNSVAPTVAELDDFANLLADSARRIAKEHFRTAVTIENKADTTPVTVADRDIELCLRAAITERFAHHGVIGEEFGSTGADREQLWVLDPIDGTQALITGVPLFGTLIALVDKQVPIVGVIEMPALDERWVATAGTTRKNGHIVRVSDETELANATLLATSPHMFSALERPRFDALTSVVKRVRYGTDCYGYGLLAEGLVDLVVEADMAPHDFMALVPVVLGAGGVITDWRGEPLGLHSDGTIIAAATEELHRAASTVLRPN